MRARILLFTLVVCCSAAGGQPDPQDIVEATDGQRYSRSEFEAGRILAQHDIRDGRLIIEVFGGPASPTYNELKRLLVERYNIHLKETAEYIVDGQIIGHQRGYNEVSRAEITRRFGCDVALETRDEVFKSY
jgi:hypothetical protein